MGAADDTPLTQKDELTSSLLQEEGALRRYLRRRLRHPEDVDDYVQEVYAHALAAGPKNKIGSMRGFLLRVASNLLIDKYRRGRTRMLDQHVSLEEQHHPDDEGAASPERALLAREQLALMQRVLEGLEPVPREVFRLVRLEGLSHREAAARLGLEVKVVSRHLERVLMLLSRALAEKGA